MQIYKDTKRSRGKNAKGQTECKRRLRTTKTMMERPTPCRDPYKHDLTT
jgi:hypothetical protein